MSVEHLKWGNIHTVKLYCNINLLKYDGIELVDHLWPKVRQTVCLYVSVQKLKWNMNWPDLRRQLLMRLTRVWIKRSSVEHKYFWLTGYWPYMRFEKRRHWLTDCSTLVPRETQALFYLHFQLEIDLLMNLKTLFVIYYFNRNTFACMSRCHGDAVRRRRALKTCVCLGWLVSRHLINYSSWHRALVFLVCHITVWDLLQGSSAIVLSSFTHPRVSANLYDKRS